MEQITPWTVTTLTFALVTLAPALTLIISAVLLWLYRRAVRRQMRVTAGIAAPLGAGMRQTEPARNAAAVARSDVASSNVARGLRGLALQYIAAGFAFAVVFALAAPFVYPHRIGPAGYLIGVWIYFWPVPVALALVMPAGWRLRAALFAGYFAVFALLVAWAGTVKDIPAINSAGILLPARSSATPQLTLRLWAVVAGLPTVLVLLCFNRWVRAVAPLVLAFVTLVLVGLAVVLLAIFSEQGVDAFVRFAVSTGLHVYWLLLAATLLALAPLGALAWLVVRIVARRYERRVLSEQSLMLDALWLIFAAFFGMWLVLGGIGWFAVAPLAFGVYKIVLVLARRLIRNRQTGRDGLTFLRVFSLGRHSDRLLDQLSRYWRHIGPVKQIAGPDTARSTVQPHQFLDFVGRRLATHFVRDQASLEHSLANCDRQRGPDGLYRINSFFCHRDTWRLALPRLAGDGDSVLMDLRSFSPDNAGCIHELEYLVASVPLDAFLLLIDRDTDAAFLRETLVRAWHKAAAEGVNRDRTADQIRVHAFAAGSERVLLRKLLS